MMSATATLERWCCWRCGQVLAEHYLTPGSIDRRKCPKCIGRGGSNAWSEKQIAPDGTVLGRQWTEPTRTTRLTS